MSGWQRIGVAISVLWFLAGYLIISSVQDANAYYQSRFKTAYDLELKSQERESAIQKCSEYSGSITLTPAKMISLLLFQHQGDYLDGLIGWAIILVPIALFWIIGGIVFATLRWIGRGFRARKI